MLHYLKSDSALLDWPSEQAAGLTLPAVAQLTRFTLLLVLVRHYSPCASVSCNHEDYRSLHLLIAEANHKFISVSLTCWCIIKTALLIQIKKSIKSLVINLDFISLGVRRWSRISKAAQRSLLEQSGCSTASVQSNKVGRVRNTEPVPLRAAAFPG